MDAIAITDTDLELIPQGGSVKVNLQIYIHTTIK